MIEFFLQNYIRDKNVWQGPKCAFRLFYDLDVCHRDDFNTCFPPPVTRPQLTNNMVLFNANGTNSSILRRGYNVATNITLSEPVTIFSTRLSEFSVSTAFLLCCKKRFSFKKSHEYEQFFFRIYLKKIKTLLFVVLIDVFKYWEKGKNFVVATSTPNLLLNCEKSFLG